MKTRRSMTAASVVVVTCMFMACDNVSENGNYDNDDLGAHSTVTESRLVNNEYARDFVKEVASDGMMEVRMAELALQKSQNGDVKELAQMIKNDHEKANEKLKMIAQNRNWTVPSAMIEKHQDKVENLQNESDADFDREYLDIMIEGHKKAIEKFEEASGNDRMLTGQETADDYGVANKSNINQDNMNGRADNDDMDNDAANASANVNRTEQNRDMRTNPAGDLQMWVENTLPTLRKHLEHSEIVRQGL